MHVVLQDLRQKFHVYLALLLTAHSPAAAQEAQRGSRSLHTAVYSRGQRAGGGGG
jgi:hypothetical protein